MSDLVIDASVALSWHFEDESEPLAETVLEQLNSQTAIVVPFFQVELLNALLFGERKARTTQAEADGFLTDVSRLNIDVDRRPSPARVLRIGTLARRHRLTAYDAAYLELALRTGLPLATLDKDLRAAANLEGVPLVSPSEG